MLEARQGFLDDTLKLYKGPLKDNKGNQVIAAGQEISNTDNRIQAGRQMAGRGRDRLDRLAVEGAPKDTP